MTTDIEGLEVTVVEKATDAAPAPAETIATESTSLTAVAPPQKEVLKSKSEKSENTFPEKPVKKTVLRKTTLTRTTSQAPEDVAESVSAKPKTVVQKKTVTKKYESPFASSSSASVRSVNTMIRI